MESDKVDQIIKKKISYIFYPFLFTFNAGEHLEFFFSHLSFPNSYKALQPETLDV